MSQRFTREEFYELVWTNPLTRLAKEFGLSDVALHKICRKHDIPQPPLGWWAKHAAGQKVKRTPLTKLGPGTADGIVIAGGELRSEPENLATMRDQARIRASEIDPELEVQAHPIITKSLGKLHSARPGPKGLLSLNRKGLIVLDIAPDSIERAETCLSRITAAAQAHGFELSGKEENAAFSDGTVHISFSLKEAVRRIKHIPTAREIAEDEELRRRRERRWSGNGWDFDHDFSFGPRRPEWDYIPTGQLAFEFDVYLRYAPQIRRSFRDAKIQRLENMAPDIAVGLVVLAAAKLEDDRKIEETRLRAEEENRRRIEAQRRDYVEERRAKAFELVLGLVERRDRLRRLVVQLEGELTGDENPRVREFVSWASATLAQVEQRVSADGLEALFATESVFGLDDDRGFSPRPYGW